MHPNQLLSSLRLALLLLLPILLCPFVSQASNLRGSVGHLSSALAVSSFSAAPSPVTLALIGFGIGFAGGCLKTRKAAK